MLENRSILRDHVRTDPLQWGTRPAIPGHHQPGWQRALLRRLIDHTHVFNCRNRGS
jgi:hypothetical protein